MQTNERNDQRLNDCTDGRSVRKDVGALLRDAGLLDTDEEVVCAEVEDSDLTAAIAEVPDR